MKNLIRKILKESEWFEEPSFQKKLKGYVIVIKSGATGAKFFVGEDDNDELLLNGFVNDIFERSGEGEIPKIINKKGDLKKIISSLKKNRPYHIFGDEYEIVKV
jgi:hypothetical protein